MSTAKNMQLGAYKKGVTDATTAKTWTEPTTDYTGVKTFPYLNLPNAVKIVTKENEEIVGKSFKTGSKLVSKQVDNPLEFYLRFKGVEYFLYWMFGFENVVKKAFVCKGTWGVGDEPEVGSAYLAGAQAVQFMMKYQGKDHLGNVSDYAVFTTDLASPTALASGEVISDASAPDILKSFTLTVTTPATTTSATNMHTYELEALDRNIREYSAAEAAALGPSATGKVRNPYMQLFKRFTEYDMKYQNAVCRSWSITSKDSEMVKVATNFLAYKQENSATAKEYTASASTLSSDQIRNVLVPAHFQTVVEIGTSVATLEEICVSDWVLAGDSPMQQIQTSCTGLHIADPLLSGKQDISFKATIARHNTQKWIDYRDAQTELCGRILCTYGQYLIVFELKRLVLKNSGAGDGDIAEEALDATVEFCLDTENPFGNIPASLQESPVVMRVFNTSTINEMLGA